MGYLSSTPIKAICFLLFVLASATSAQTAQNARCPFDLLFHLGDGVFDNGNAIANKPYGAQLPAASLPYGETYPGKPTGRWSDGLLDIDYGAQSLGFTKIEPYLTGNMSSANAIIFAVARSPVLDRRFFTSRGIKIPPYAASLSIQMSWFKKYLSTICSTTEDCTDKMVNSLFLFGDVEANDIAFALTQGKSVEEAQTYIPNITATLINSAREVIKLGAIKVILTGNGPIGCYPYILTELASNNTDDYDDVGCLKNVNNLIVAKNNDLMQAIDDLRLEFPNILINYADFYSTIQFFIRESILNGTNGNLTLQACCGSGGKYNYNKDTFCGSSGVTSCADPSQYIFWDGLHLTDEANKCLSKVLAAAALPTLDCVLPPSLTQLWSTFTQVPKATSRPASHYSHLWSSS